MSKPSRRYWSDLVSFDGGLSVLMIDGLLAVPLVMAAFLYPLQVLDPPPFDQASV
jgi:hypothetical protein